MEYIARYLGIIFGFMRREFVLFGYSMSFFDIFVFVIVAGILASAIRRIFDD